MITDLFIDKHKFKVSFEFKTFIKIEVFLFFVCFQFVLSGLLRISSYFSWFWPTVHAESRHGTPSLTVQPKDEEVSCEVRPLRSPSGV